MDENLMNTEVETESDVIGMSEYEDTSSVEEPEVAETEGAEDSNVEKSTQDEQTPIDVNAIAAAARRKAEAETRQMQSNLDAEYVRRFGHLTNPKTGQPIRSQADYLAALDAQEQMKAEQELSSKGIDPEMINNLIANNPTVRQAQSVIEQNEKTAALTQINNDIAELGKLDPTITSLENVPPDVVALSVNSGGNINLVNAYKIINYGKVSSSKEAAITQNAINQAKGKQHLNPVNGVATPEEGVEIPSSVLSMWKEVFPNKSNAELKKLYNDSL